jgi:hypothetical protein
MKNTHFSNPKCFILHCGTNDLEKIESDQELITLIENVVKLITDQYPNCRIIISGLLPQKDHLNENITLINNKLEKILANKANASFIQHNNVKPTEDLKDKKHLNQKVVKFFTKNIKAAYFNTTPKKKTSKRNTQNVRPGGVFPQQRYPIGFQPTPNPYSPVYHIPLPSFVNQPPHNTTPHRLQINHHIMYPPHTIHFNHRICSQPKTTT